MPDEPKPRRPVLVLKMPCPKCKGVLEQEQVDPAKGKPARVRCSNPQCKKLWPSYKDMLKDVGPKKLTPDDFRKALVKGKAMVRGTRNVVERCRTAQRKLRSAAQAIRNIKQEGAVTEVGASLEGVVDQLILSLDDVKDAVKGEVKPFAGDEVEGKEDA
jgi:hypothetical protein